MGWIKKFNNKLIWLKQQLLKIVPEQQHGSQKES